MNTIEGKLINNGYKFAIVASRFNDFIVKHLIDGAVDFLFRHNVDNKDITIYRTPGCFEIPLMTLEVIEKKQSGC